MAFSQVLAFKAGRIDQLWKVSSIVGFSYGSVFSLLPMVTLEWFGVKHFASVGRILDIPNLSSV